MQMNKKMLITGATDGIGLETAKKLAAMGREVLIHGRNPAKLDAAAHAVEEHARLPRYSLTAWTCASSSTRWRRCC
ncbi:hypothetical protein GCM10007052_04250 [Halioglobus japonicus]|nr:hypothetical protein GCM10007052_04250 [Halioglobus japonicus]